MRKFLFPLLKMKYPGDQKVDIFTGYMLFSTCYRVPVPIKHQACMVIHLELFNTGFSDLFPEVLLDCGIKNDRDVPANFHNQTIKNYEKKYDALPENWDTSKIYGMAHCFPIILKDGIQSSSVSDNANDFSISWDSPCNGPAQKLRKQIPLHKKSLKKIPPINKGPNYSIMGRRRSPFSKAQQFITDVVSTRSTAKSYYCYDPSESWFLWSNQLENRSSLDQKGIYFQCRYIWRFYSLSPPSYTGKNIFNS